MVNQVLHVDLSVSLIYLKLIFESTTCFCDRSSFTDMRCLSINIFSKTAQPNHLLDFDQTLSENSFLKLFLSEITRHISFRVSVKHHQEVLYQKGSRFYFELYRKKLETKL